MLEFPAGRFLHVCLSSKCSWNAAFFTAVHFWRAQNSCEKTTTRDSTKRAMTQAYAPRQSVVYCLLLLLFIVKNALQITCFSAKWKQGSNSPWEPLMMLLREIMINIIILKIFSSGTQVPRVMLATCHRNVSNCILWNLLRKQCNLPRHRFALVHSLPSIQSHSNDITLQLPGPFVHNQWNSMSVC